MRTKKESCRHYSIVAVIQLRGTERVVQSGIRPLPLLFASSLPPLSISEGRRLSTTPREDSAVSGPPSPAPFPFDPAAPDHPALSPPQLRPSVPVLLAVGATRDTSCTPFFPSEDWIPRPFGSLHARARTPVPVREPVVHVSTWDSVLPQQYSRSLEQSRSIT